MLPRVRRTARGAAATKDSLPKLADFLRQSLAAKDSVSCAEPNAPGLY